MTERWFKILLLLISFIICFLVQNGLIHHRFFALEISSTFKLTCVLEEEVLHKAVSMTEPGLKFETQSCVCFWRAFNELESLHISIIKRT